MGGDVEGGALAGTGGEYVEHFPGQAGGDERVGGVGGAALGAVRGGGVEQLDLSLHVVGRQPDPPAVPGVPDRQRSVGVPPFDVPGVAVLDPVPGAREVPVPQPQPVRLDLPAADTAGAGVPVARVPGAEPERRGCLGGLGPVERSARGRPGKGPPRAGSWLR